MTDDAPGTGEAPATGAAAVPEDKPDTRFDRGMVEMLVCPQTRAPLTLDRQKGELVSKAAHLAYPIRNGIPVMLADEARKLD